MTDQKAVGIAEGFIENPGKTDEERQGIEIAAWQHLIDTGLAWKLQGWFGAPPHGSSKPAPAPGKKMKSPTRTDTHSIHIQWEPGNGTRYDVIITHLEQTFMGHAAGIYLVTVSDAPRPTAFFVTKDGGYIVHQWVSEKTGLNAHDASVVAEMVAAVLERPVGVTEEDWYRERVPVPFAEVYKSKGSQ